MSSSPTPVSRRSNEERAKRIEQYYIRHDKDKKKTYLHFMDEGLSKKTIYHILRRHDQRGDVSFKKPTGRRVSVCTPEMFDKVANLFKENPELSCREGAKKLGIARTTIFRVMAKMRENNLETYKVIDSEPRCPTCHQKIETKKSSESNVSSSSASATSTTGPAAAAAAVTNGKKKRKTPTAKASKRDKDDSVAIEINNVDNLIDQHPNNSNNQNLKDYEYSLV